MRKSFKGRVNRWVLTVLIALGTGSATPRCLAQNEDATPKNATATDKQPLVPVTPNPYVDFRNGFSMVVPSACIPRNLRHIIIAPVRYPRLNDWKLPLSPASKELVRFIDPISENELVVTLFGYNSDTTVDKLLAARRTYWQEKNPVKLDAKPINDPTTDPESPDLAVLLKDEKGNYIAIAESLVTCQPHQAFLLAAVMPIKTTTETPAEQPPCPDYQRQLQRFAQESFNSFACWGETLLQQRWAQARKRAQRLLSQLKLATVQDMLISEQWFQLYFHRKNVGFLVRREHVPDAKGDQATALQINEIGYCDNGTAAGELFNSFGCNRIGSPDSDMSPFVSPYYVHNDLQLYQDLRSGLDRFEVHCIEAPRASYTIERQWDHNTLNLATTAWDRPGQATQNEQQLEVNEELFVSAALMRLLDRIIDPQAGAEYAFMHYSNGALGYYSLGLKTASTNGALPISSGNADLPASTHPPVVPSYAVGQLGTHGPIIETWFNPTGKTIVVRSNNLQWVPCTRDDVEKRWPEQVKRAFEMQQTAPAPNPKPAPLQPEPPAKQEK